MKAFAVLDQGLEEAFVQEIKDLLGVKAEARDTIGSFEAELQDICKFTARMQSAQRILVSVGDWKFRNLDSLLEKAEKALEEFELEKWLLDSAFFRATCKRIGNHDFSSSEVEAGIGESVIKAAKNCLGSTPGVSLDKPDAIFYCHIFNDRAVLGIDLAGRDLSKREFKIYTVTASLRGPVCYALVKLSGHEKGKVFLNPFAGDGAIAIEAAKLEQGGIHHKNLILTKMPATKELSVNEDRNIEGKEGVPQTAVHALDESLRNVRCCRNNAKIAGVEINPSKASVEFLDTRFDKNSVDAVCCYPPQASSRIPAKEVEKYYDELLYQAEFVLKKDGCLVALMLNKKPLLEMAGKHGWKVDKETVITTGDLEYSALRIVKG